MRIGILTFHKPINYGAFLQAFSLSQRLKKEFQGAEIEIIDYIAPKEKRQIYINILRDFKHSGISGGIQSIKKYFVFRKAQKYLPLSDKYLCTDKLETLYSYIKERYDCLVIGSDAVFNWNQTRFPTAFIPDFDFGIPVFTYAASVHGLKYYDVNSKMIEKCRSAFEKMSFVGVRDACTQNFIKFCSPQTEPHFCCDPTLFIDCDSIKSHAGDYSTRIRKKYNFSFDKKYIVFMAPDSALTESIAKKYKKDYTIISLFKKSKYSDIFMYDLDPFEWAMILRGAEATVTNYFHGTLLSLVQNTPTVVLDYSGYDNKYQGKLDDLMNTRFALSEFYFTKKFACNFTEGNNFFEIFENMLQGTYTERIKKGKANLQKSAEDFVLELKSKLEYNS
ncbi:MAG: polysaccharide pyruvyl transferase family protein [Clostridia bacterium]|nr:polysaccharide pyruvyl transferase family protein [Clostridia bacterium]